ncbi:hypothetical protein BaRGS_00011310 [Batillaria attramentaria]|uniref:Nucleotide-diphospho-sugar transferase domain-containing protein n=1 Tax=Batillaria attramentaria TaxID=370345 RepID=A0ABD0LDI3_9CAEN
MNRLRQVLLCLVVVLISMSIYFALLPSQYKHQWKSSTYVSANQFFNSSAGAPPSNSTDRLVWDVYKKHKLVLFTMINDAFVPFAMSWLCNTKPLDVHKQVVFLTTDNESSQTLKHHWPDITTVSLNTSGFSGAQEYSHVGYVQLMVERTHFIKKLLEADIHLLLFEVDSTWLANPLPKLMALQNQGDIIATKVTGQDVTAGGFLLLNPTPATVKLWQRLTDMMDDLSRKLKSKKISADVSESLNDQQFFTQLLRQKYAGIQIVYLPQELYPDGKWYSLPVDKRQQSPRPIIINNNWIVGNTKKIERAKQFGHWFVKAGTSAGACNETAVKSLFLVFG